MRKVCEAEVKLDTDRCVVNLNLHPLKIHVILSSSDRQSEVVFDEFFYNLAI